MNTIIASPQAIIPLGRLGENEHTQVRFPVARWLEEYPGCSFALLNRLPGADDAFPVADTELDGSDLVWTVGSGALSAEGRGECQLIISVGDVVAKSVIYATSVRRALDGGGDAPDEWESWQSVLTGLKTAAEAAAAEAVAKADEIEDVVAAEYRATGRYAVGDYCMHEGTLYRCITPITLNQNWNSANWDEVKLGNEVVTIKNTLGISLAAKDPYIQRGYIAVSNDQWDNRDTGDPRCAIIPVNGGAAVTIKSASGAATRIAALKSFDNPDNGETADFSDDETWASTIEIHSNNTQSFVMPDDAVYLYIWLGNWSGLARMPQAIQINGYDYTKSLFANVMDRTNSLITKIEKQTVSLETHIDQIPNETDYDTLKAAGSYAVSRLRSVSTMNNCPTTLQHRLYVTRLYPGSAYIYQIIVCSDYAMTQYIRRYSIDNSTWSEWEGLGKTSVAKYVPVFTQYNNDYAQNVSRIKRGGVTAYDTLPIERGILGDTTCYAEESTIPSVIYSSVWRDGLDVYRNITLETYYSALANPASVLYTKTYTDKGIHNAHSWYGGVCSSYVGSLAGIRKYQTVEQLVDSGRLISKTIASATDISVGDVLTRGDKGHIAIVTQIYVDGDGAISGVAVSEQKAPYFESNIIPIRNFDAWMQQENYTLKQWSEALTVRQYDDPTFDKYVLFERGNNTYITAAELQSGGAWFYIQDSETVYVSKDGGEETSAALSSLDSKTVNEVTVYDLSALMDGVGLYSISTDNEEPKPCQIKVIDTGIKALSGNVLQLSGWQGCYPYNYYIVKEVSTESGYSTGCMDPSPGYYCAYTGDCGDITCNETDASVTVTIPQEYLSGLDRYKIWIEYQTGMGLKQDFSNLVVIS